LKHILWILFLFQSLATFAEKYWVTFTDKSDVKFDPYSYFSERTIEQRKTQGLPVCDSLDFPVSEKYCAEVTKLSDSVSYTSRWLNGIALYTTPERIETIRQLPFVAKIRMMQNQGEVSSFDYGIHDLKKNNLALLHYQTDRLGGNDFSTHHLNGKGVRIAVFDVGFKGVDKNEAFKKLREEKRIIATYDFIGKKEDVYVSHWHGTATLSCIAGELDSIKIGMATGAEILLARTERISSETLFEEECWLAAVEWADKNGANIINSSLGYTKKRYFNSQMDGRQSLISMAATIAASKGILVVNSAGNDGNSNWHYIDTPGDADSVLTVGGTDPGNDIHVYFSSFGPTSDGRLKPNVSAPGQVMCAGAQGMKEAFGTSFSSPLVAGFAACAWQANRSLSNMQLFREIEKSGHLYPYFDYAHGYGIPQALHFIDTSKAVEPTFDFVIVNDQIKVVLREKYSYALNEASMGYDARRNLYYKVQDKNGKIKSYQVMLAARKEILDLQAQDFSAGDEVTIHFEGYTSSFDIPSIESEEIK